MKHQMPAQLLDARNRALEEVLIGPAAQMLHEIESYAAYATLVQLAEFPIVRALVDDGDAAVVPAAGGYRIQRRAVVGAVAARLDDHRAGDAQKAVQRHETLLGRVGGRVAALRRIGKDPGRAEDVAMRIATLR